MRMITYYLPGLVLNETHLQRQDFLELYPILRLLTGAMIPMASEDIQGGVRPAVAGPFQ